MKITVIYLGRKGGAPIFTFEMVKALIKNGCTITCILSEYIENYNKFTELRKESKYLKIYFEKTFKTKIQFIINALNIFNFLKIKKIVNNEKADFIYIPMLTLWSSLLLFFLKNKNIIMTIHDVEMHKGEENIFLEKLYSNGIKKSRKIIVLSQRFILQVMNKYGFEKKNICWIPHANHNYYIPSNESILEDGTIYKKILFFGRIHKYKGLEILLKVMLAVNDKNDNNRLKLKIVGDGNITPTENEMIKALGSSIEVINKWIEDDDVHYYFQDIDFTVLPYIEASQSGVIMLSYSFKKPVIVTDIGGLPEQVNPSTGVIVPANDVKALSDAILKMYENPSRIIQMGNMAYNFATNELTWDKSAEKLIQFLYEE
jgi:glycosyltransferase involved in cell wall biosynthesis